MKKIVINFTGRRGGGPIVSLETTKAFLLKGYEVSAIISSDIDNLEDWRELKLKKLVIINTYNSLLQFIFNTIIFSFRQKKIIKNNLKEIGEVDFVYCPMGASWSYRINKIIDREYYIVNHDPIPHSGENLLFKIYRLVFNTKKVYKKAKAIIVHAEKFIDYTKDKFKNENVIYIPLGIHINQSSNKEFDDSNNDSNKVNFLFFGRITKYKGLNILWEAYKKLLGKYKQQITLSIVGEGDLKLNISEIKKATGTNVVNEWIPNEDVYKYFGRKNVVLVCPYIDATQSGVIMLGYDFLVPVIATKTGGIPEQVQDNITGLLIEPNSIDELYKAMEKFILNIDILSKYSFNIKSYMSNFSWIKSIGEFEKYIDLEGTKGGEC